MNNDPASLEDNLVAPYKTKYKLTIQFSIALLGVYSRELET
jgi:hypothetical protein